MNGKAKKSAKPNQHAKGIIFLSLYELKRPFMVTILGLERQKRIWLFGLNQ